MTTPTTDTPKLPPSGFVDGYCARCGSTIPPLHNKGCNDAGGETPGIARGSNLACPASPSPAEMAAAVEDAQGWVRRVVVPVIRGEIDDQKADAVDAICRADYAREGE